MTVPARKIRVLIVDDSASVRETMKEILGSDPDIEVIGAVSDPFVAAAHIRQQVPDVLTLDVEMPRMDGISFLRRIMAQRPIPAVICSSLTEAGSDTLFQALEAGAVEVITKPSLGTRQFLLESRIRIIDAVKAAAQANLRPRPPARPPEGKLSADAVLAPPASGEAIGRTTDKIVCIGASTGGTDALLTVLRALPADCPPIAVVQHMPEHFTAAFARRLDGLCTIRVKEAANGEALLRGHALIAPGNRHMLIKRNGARYQVELREGPLVSRHRPSVDVLFRSAARHAGANAMGVIMTGMGDDGAHGLLEMRQAGALTLAQDEESCIVFGMPREAIRIGAAQRVAALEHLASEILKGYAVLQRSR
ncbi:chemotaxis response regulator protein-glutamate methylesterase [Telmatospirillum sp. J64-1]|uniref:protein-glutamate methylesterase/protein-glutamine glutaminase n=1 Tax=Telmatospirillum sp. J64-1 TaxID=2502183 RepID=UPI00115F246A|nr:chemotaxis response regulator protein-glutamate methylesterase [Telmatospirillum sp. J64-1]